MQKRGAQQHTERTNGSSDPKARPGLDYCIVGRGLEQMAAFANGVLVMCWRYPCSLSLSLVAVFLIHSLAF